MNRLGGDVLYQFNNHSHTQMMGYVMESDDAVIAVDGGTECDGAALEEFLLGRGGRVDAWFVTHAHFDHVMAVVYILRRKKIDVGALYFRFPRTEILREYERRESRLFSCADEFLACVSESGVKTVEARKGDVVKAGSFTVRILTDGGREAGNINDTSVVYRVETRGEPVLFLGDLGKNVEAELLEEYPGLIRCPVVQMAHHGQGGVSERFYDFIRPQVCLWSTPDWLWTNRDGKGPYKTLETRAWVAKYNAENVNSFNDIAVLK